MGLFTIKSCADSAHHSPYEKSEKRKKREKKTHKDKAASSVSISHKFKTYLSLKQNEVNLLQLLEKNLREGIIEKEAIKKILGLEYFGKLSEIFALIEQQKDLIFEQYIEFYNRPLVLNAHIPDAFTFKVFDQAQTCLRAQTDHLTQEHLKLT
ncbi:MAG: hypothetical protein DRQ89_07860 [Epsilonproteobacteria bacterium]|nr:MAG: hypothetical protein DRQ89_07860 [Campylobacterota bacterium]